MPSLHQIVAFSRISGYRLADWLVVFGFDLENITRLQVSLPCKRTILLDTSLTDSEAWIPWFRSRESSMAVPRIAPLVQLLEPTHPQRIASLSQFSDRHFLYAKVGSEDAFAFPELAPGSIVRIDSKRGEDTFLSEINQGSERIFLIKHSKGLCCCPVRSLMNDVILPVGRSIPYARIPFRVPEEARILGVADLEIRTLLKNEAPTVPQDLARRWKPQTLVADTSLGQRLHHARTMMNLSLREAADGSKRIAEMCGNPHYRISASSLFDYEQSVDSPRDFHKIASLCSLYGMQFWLFLDAMGMTREHDPIQAVPDGLLGRHALPEPVTAHPDEQKPRFLEKALEPLEDLPLFLRNSLHTLAKSAKLSVDDFFWIGGEDNPLHPFLSHTFLAIVNRRRKTAFHFAAKPFWQQPIYLVLMRDGEYLAGCFGNEDGTLVIHPYSGEFYPPLVLRNHQDAEATGQIVAIARRLS